MNESDALALLGIRMPITLKEFEDLFPNLLRECNEEKRVELLKAIDVLLTSPIFETSREYAGKEETGQNGSMDTDALTGLVLLNRYKVGELIGTGGMGEVYKCFDRVRDEIVAIKRLLPILSQSKEAKERFRLEARISCNLSHPGIVRIYDVHEDRGLIFLTMELLKGHSLRKEIDRRNSLAQSFSLEEVVRWGREICDALEYLHGQIVHRDIKPENIWLCDNGKLKLMDFGISKSLDAQQLTKTSLAMGTLHYMPLEQLQGSEFDGTTDQYALAVTLYELLTRKLPLGAFKSPAELRKDVPRNVSYTVMRGLQPEKTERFPTIKAFSSSLISHEPNSTGKRKRVIVSLIALSCLIFISLPLLRFISIRTTAANLITRTKPASDQGAVLNRLHSSDFANEVHFRSPNGAVSWLAAVRTSSLGPGERGELYIHAIVAPGHRLYPLALKLDNEEDFRSIVTIDSKSSLLLGTLSTDSKPSWRNSESTSFSSYSFFEGNVAFTIPFTISSEASSNIVRIEGLIEFATEVTENGSDLGYPGRVRFFGEFKDDPLNSKADLTYLSFSSDT